MKRFIIIAVVLIAALGLALPLLKLDFLRPPVERALQRGLGRRVEVGAIHFTLFAGPGFTVSDVTIHEDPRAGIEPFAYVEALEARVRPWALLRRRLEFSSIRLAGASIINVVKSSAGPWNFQFLLEGNSPDVGTSGLSAALPAIRMRSGRVNFKIADTKSLFYFDDADLDVSPSADGSFEVRFSGAPSRTDRSAQDFGHFFVRGTSHPSPSGPQLAMTAELEPSALEEVARLFDRGGFGLHGALGLEAQISGTPSNLSVTGAVSLSELHSWNLLGRGGWNAGYKGTLDLHGERLAIESAAEVAGSPLEVHFHLSDFLATPHWSVAGTFNHAAVAALADVARRMGAALPEKIALEGLASGEVSYGDISGIAGRLEIQDATFGLPDAVPLHAAMAALSIDGEGISLEPTPVQIGESENAEIEARYTFPAPGNFELKLSTKNLGIGALRSLGLGVAPMFDQVTQGTWRGSMRYLFLAAGNPEGFPATPMSSPQQAAGNWSGEYELQNARLAVDGFADPVRIQSASISVNGERVAATRLRGKAGAISFTGDYRWLPGVPRPHQFHLDIPEADAAELQRLLEPALVRRSGFLARTLGFAAPQIPEWLTNRHASGTLGIGTLMVGAATVHVDAARLTWDGPVVRLTGISGGLDQVSLPPAGVLASPSQTTTAQAALAPATSSQAAGAPAAFAGDLTLDLASGDPHYKLEGKLQDFAYKGGKIDVEGKMEADGAGLKFLGSLQGDGTLRGRSITFVPDAEFRTLSASFQMTPGLAGPHIKLSDVEATQGSDTYTGQGTTQADGRLLLDLASRGRQFKYTGALSAAVPQP